MTPVVATGARVTRLPVDPGTLAAVGWREHGWATLCRPLSPATSTVCGRRTTAEEWARLRWGGELVDGASDGSGVGACGLYLHVRALLPGEPDDGEHVVYRVRSRLIPGRRVVLVDGVATARARVTSVGLARDSRGGGGWAWVVAMWAAKGERR